jgi:hypothetical protein
MRHGEDGYGNAVPMETKKRFPQGLGNLAQNARFPHSHSRSSVLKKGETKNEDEWLTGHQINWSQDHHRILGHIQDRQE